MTGRRAVGPGVTSLEPGQAPPLLTHRFPVGAYDQAYQVLRAGPDNSGPRGKVMLEVGTP